MMQFEIGASSLCPPKWGGEIACIYGNVARYFIMEDFVHIKFRYSGPSVDDGTMSVDEVIEALQGFANAYEKISDRVSHDTPHQLRGAGVQQGSFEMLILAGMIFTQYGDQIKNIGSAIEGVKYILKIIKGVIDAKKHAKGAPYSISVHGDNNTVLMVNLEGTPLAIEPAVLEILKEKLIDKELRKISEPLEQGSIESAEIIAEGESISTKIESAEKPYFQLAQSDIRLQEIEVTGKLVSLNKERDKGTFKLNNNARIPYRFTGENREQFHSDFSHEGPVRIVGTAELDDNLQPIRLDIRAVVPLQADLLLSPPNENNEQ